MEKGLHIWTDPYNAEISTVNSKQTIRIVLSCYCNETSLLESAIRSCQKSNGVSPVTLEDFGSKNGVIRI